MCGIVGCVGYDGAASVLLRGLHRLEYRGYDSAGIAVGNGHGLEVVKRVGPVSALDDAAGLGGLYGLGHTRWATHGAPTEANAHPHLSCDGTLAIVHNGILENHLELRRELEQRGHVFQSTTDSEVAVHLIEEAYEGDLLAAVLAVRPRLRGSYALAAATSREPDVLVTARHRSPLVVGLAQGATLLGSDVTPLLEHTRRVVHLEDGDVARLTPQGVEVLDVAGKPRAVHPTEVTWSLEDAEKGGFETYMLKEIHDQPHALHEVLRGRLEDDLGLEGSLAIQDLLDAPRVLFLGMGTSHHAGLLATPILEGLAGVPTTAALASELRHGPVLDTDAVAIAVSQSGETADTLAAVRHARLAGLPVLGVTNVVGSTLHREADGVLHLRAGPEVSVAATKSFTSQVTLLTLLALRVARARGAVTAAEVQRLEADVRRLPRVVQQVIETTDPGVGRRLAEHDHAFYLGRHVNVATALEGALKLKEVSYVHAEGFAGGELKHGPLALLEPGTPVVGIVGPDATRDVMLGNLGEVAARGAHVVAVASRDDEEVPQLVDEVLPIPPIHPLLFPVPASVALQLVAYHAARARNLPVDRPRNLAKSVTVE